MLVPIKMLRIAVITICMFAVGVISIHAEEKKEQAAYPGWEGMTHAMQKSMDPNVWSQMMAMMMDPSKSSPIASCALCHEGEDVARFQKDFGPMMDAMWQPYKSMMNPHMMTSMMNPNAYMSMMGPMMNPAMYMNMMGPMMAMSGPMMGQMMNPMGWMNPAMYMNMMYPMMGMMGPMMGPMGGGMGMHGNPMTQMPGGQMMDPKQYEQWFNQWTEMMKNFTPPAQPQQ